MWDEDTGALVLGSLCLEMFGTAAPIMDEVAFMGKVKGNGGEDTSTLPMTARILLIRNGRPGRPAQHRVQEKIMGFCFFRCSDTSHGLPF